MFTTPVVSTMSVTLMTTTRLSHLELQFKFYKHHLWQLACLFIQDHFFFYTVWSADGYAHTYAQIKTHNSDFLVSIT